MAKKPKLWIFEYKDDSTKTGATFLDKFIEDINSDEELILPHLQEPWHWRMQITWEERENDEE